jgi:formate hydrogenlyase subunit 6/NADH:ubiquinone oxidoreductase subunit I
MGWRWRLIEGECTGCGICADLCPESAIQMTLDMGYPAPVPGKCVGCMICPQQCPFDAIVVEAGSAAVG